MKTWHTTKTRFETVGMHRGDIEAWGKDVLEPHLGLEDGPGRLEGIANEAFRSATPVERATPGGSTCP